METSQERSKAIEMISASRSTIQDPETLKNVSLLKMMDLKQKDDFNICEIQSP
jgi:hypothetical protein